MQINVIVKIVFVGLMLFTQNMASMTVEEYRELINRPVRSVQDLSAIFPKSVDEIELHAELGMKMAQQDLDKLLSINAADRTFDNTVRAFDQSWAASFFRLKERINTLSWVSPDKEIRDANRRVTIKLTQFGMDAYWNSAALDQAIQDYRDHQGKTELLNDEQRYFLQETKPGSHLSEQQLSKEGKLEVEKLEKEIAELYFEFEKNIAADKSSIKVGLQGLDGVNEQMIKSLVRDGDQYVLGCDYPTYNEIMENCQDRETRKKLYFAFNNRAYPENVKILELILEKRDMLAKKLGFESYAALDIDSEMAKTPERVESFLQDLAQKASKKMSEEFAVLRQNLPDGVTLDEQGRMYPWDYEYVKSLYKRKYFNIDERVLAEYFPVDKVLEGVFNIYQDFFGLEFKKIVPDWKWHEDVELIQINDKKTQTLCGYLFLDLYPRDDKYDGASNACYGPLIATQLRKNMITGVFEFIPSVSVITANFPRPSEDRPALLKYSDVTTFFHMFGYAMHGCLGCTEFATFSGTSCKWDFAEMPAQLFEQWMFDKHGLKRVTSHYKTGESLPDAFIENKIALKLFDSGYSIQKRVLFSLVALYYHKTGVHKDTDIIMRALHEKYMPEISFESDTHCQASFGFLMGYGARYYSHIWSKVFALDIFEQIKEAGFSQAIGQKFVQTILGRGGSADPNVLLKDFLGREPKSDAFMKDLGLV